MADALTILRSSIDANSAISDVIARNIAGSNQPGYTQKEQQIKSNVISGSMCGVLANDSDVTRFVVDSLVKDLRNQQSLVCYTKYLNEISQNIQQIHGNKGAQNSIAHDIENCVTNLHNYATSRTQSNATQVLHQFNILAKDLVMVDDKLQDLIYQVDADLTQDVKKVNALIKDVAATSAEIINLTNAGYSVADLQDKVDQDLHTLSNYLNINVSYSSTKPPQLSVTTANGTTLINSSYSYNTLEYDDVSNIAAGTNLPDLKIKGASVTGQITKGSLAAQKYLVDTVLNGVRDCFAELTRQIRDQVNAVHNEGTGQTPPDTLTGTIGAPGSGGALTTSTSLSGAGVVRIGTLNSAAGLATYADIDLSTITDMTGLMNAINGSSAGVTASISSQGEFVLTTNTSGNGVAIGSVGSTKATFTDTTASVTYGFSHYFGLNNLFQTTDSLPGTKTAGLAGVISLRSDLINNGVKLATGRLDSSATPGTVALLPGDTSVVQDIQKALNVTPISIPAAGDLPITYCTVNDYARRIIDDTTNLYKDSTRELKKEEGIYMQLSTTANEVSGVDVKQQLLEMVKNLENQKVNYKALQLCLEMQSALMSVIK